MVGVLGVKIIYVSDQTLARAIAGVALCNGCGLETGLNELKYYGVCERCYYLGSSRAEPDCSHQQ